MSKLEGVLDGASAALAEMAEMLANWPRLELGGAEITCDGEITLYLYRPGGQYRAAVQDLYDLAEAASTAPVPLWDPAAMTVTVELAPSAAGIRVQLRTALPDQTTYRQLAPWAARARPRARRVRLAPPCTRPREGRSTARRGEHLSTTEPPQRQLENAMSGSKRTFELAMLITPRLVGQYGPGLDLRTISHELQGTEDYPEAADCEEGIEVLAGEILELAARMIVSLDWPRVGMPPGQSAASPTAISTLRRAAARARTARTALETELRGFWEFVADELEVAQTPDRAPIDGRTLAYAVRSATVYLDRPAQPFESAGG